jgi:hypothetical protein
LARSNYGILFLIPTKINQKKRLIILSKRIKKNLNNEVPPASLQTERALLINK